MPQDRRTFLAGIGAAALGITSWRPAAALPPIGLQLYTLRREMAQDLPGTLARVAEIGYKEVEFAGYFQRTPADIRALLSQSGLSAPSTHVGYDLLERDWQRTLDASAEIGHSYVTIPSLPGRVRGTLDGWKSVAEAFNRGAEQARARGLRFAFHNHAAEFTLVEGAVPLDRLIADTDPALVDFQMDVYWVANAGHDPLAYLTRYGSRFRMLHLKDSAGAPEHRMTDVGSGSIDWTRIFAAAEVAGVRHSFVEHDNPQDAWASVRASYAYLSPWKR